MIRVTVRTFVVAIIALATSVAALPPVGAAVTKDVEVLNNRFQPRTVVVAEGDSVHWNKDSSGQHDLVAEDGAFASYGPATTAPWDHTVQFDDAGEYGYYCSVHGSFGGGGMSGTVVVTDGSTSSLSIGDVSRTEGHSGTKSFNLTVTMDDYQADDVTVDYATGDGSATAGSDYVATAGTLTIPSGSLSGTVTVQVNGDVDIEPDETFTVTLSAPSANATIADGSGTGTIQNDDPPSDNEPPAPVADAGGPYETVEGGTVTLDGSGSSDPEDGGSIESHAWDTDGDGNTDATGATVVVEFPDDGVFTVTLTVTDDDDQDASDDATVTVHDGASVARASGEDRILTAVASARRGWSGSEHALLATGFAFPDALAATALAAKLDAPLLLTRKDDLPEEVLQALNDLGVETVWILGGASAVSQQVEDELRQAGFTIERRRGDDRFETASVVAREVGASATAEVVVALGQHADVVRDSWPDALSAGSLSAGPDRLPTLLTRSDHVPAATERALRDLATRKVWLLGGAVAISGVVETRLRSLGYEVERLQGPSRYGTSVAVAQQALSRLPAGDVPLVFATGANFPDGLTAGAYAARVGGLVVLVHPTDLAGGAAAVRDFIDGDASRFDVGTVIGGTTAVTTGVFAELLDAMRA